MDENDADGSQTRSNFSKAWRPKMAAIIRIRKDRASWVDTLGSWLGRVRSQPDRRCIHGRICLRITLAVVDSVRSVIAGIEGQCDRS